LLFTTIVAGVGGKELYNRLYVDEDLTVFGHPKIQRVLSILAQLRAFKPLPGQIETWDHLCDLIASGMDFKDKIICSSPPEAENIFIAAIDFIAFPKVQSKEEQAGQRLLVKTVLDKDLQISFSNLKGSTPVRNDIQADKLNSCAAKRLPFLTNKQRRLLSPRMTMDENLRSALQKTLAAFWNNGDITVKQVTLQLKKLKI
jgi:glucose/mannose transport system substrate-binding protein